MMTIKGPRCRHSCVDEITSKITPKFVFNLLFVAVKVMFFLFIAIQRMGFFHTDTTIVIFGKFSTFSDFLKISKAAPTTFLKLSQYVLDNNNKKDNSRVLLTLIY